MRHTRLAPALFLLAPIVGRHDRPAEAYLELGRRHPCVVDVGSEGVGTLIAPRWVLTAAHVAQGITPFDARVGLDTEAHGEGGRDVGIDYVVLHPGFDGDGGAPDHDIALVRLAEPVADRAPAKLYRKDDEAGREIVLVGCGVAGDGVAGASFEDRKWRGATSRVWKADGHRLEFRFERGDAATELEGTWGPGDSGGPSLLEEDGTLWVLSVASHAPDSTEGLQGLYGSRDVSFRVSAYTEWIEERMAELAKAPCRWEEPAPLAGGELPDSRAGRCARALFGAWKAGTEAAWAEFDGAWGGADYPGSEPLREVAADLGPLTPTHVSAFEDGGLAVLGSSPRIDEGIVLTLGFADGRLASVGVAVVPRDE